MPRIPGDPAPFDPFAQPAADPNVAPNYDGPNAAGEPVTLSDDALRTAATGLGLQYDGLNAEEREFVAMFARGALDPLSPEADPENPLIPGDPADPASPTADQGAATPEPGGEGVVGTPEGQPGEGQTVPDPLGTPAPPSDPAAIAPVAPPPGLPAFAIPSPLPPEPAPAVPAPVVGEGAQGQPQPQLVMLPNGALVTLEQARAIQAQAAQQQPPTAPPAPSNPFAPQPTPQYPTPFGTEYVDERAGAEIAHLNARYAQLEATLEANARAQRAQFDQGINQAIAETKAGYAQARGLTPEQVDTLEQRAAQLQIVGNYAVLYPGDPRRAVGAALEAVYWMSPEFRQHEIDMQLARTREANAAVDERKANATALASPSGSVPRTPAQNPATMSRTDRDAGMVAMIESDPFYQSQRRR